MATSTTTPMQRNCVRRCARSYPHAAKRSLWKQPLAHCPWDPASAFCPASACGMSTSARALTWGTRCHITNYHPRYSPRALPKVQRLVDLQLSHVDSADELGERADEHYETVQRCEQAWQRMRSPGTAGDGTGAVSSRRCVDSRGTERGADAAEVAGAGTQAAARGVAPAAAVDAVLQATQQTGDADESKGQIVEARTGDGTRGAPIPHPATTSLQPAPRMRRRSGLEHGRAFVIHATDRGASGAVLGEFGYSATAATAGQESPLIHSDTCTNPSAKVVQAVLRAASSGKLWDVHRLMSTEYVQARIASIQARHAIVPGAAQAMSTCCCQAVRKLCPRVLAAGEFVSNVARPLPPPSLPPPNCIDDCAGRGA